MNGKTTTRRKPGAKASGRRKKSVAALPARKEFGGKGYTKKACSRLKTAAKKTADSARASGKLARIVSNPAGGYCVYVRSK